MLKFLGSIGPEILAPEEGLLAVLTPLISIIQFILLKILKTKCLNNNKILTLQMSSLPPKVTSTWNIIGIKF